MALSPRHSRPPDGTKETFFSGIVLTLGTAASFVIGVLTALGGRQPGHPSAKRLSLSGACLLVAVALLAAQRLSRNARTTLAVTLLSLVVAGYAAELYLRWSTTHELWALAHNMGLPFDPRLPFEVARDLGREGKEAYPEAHPTNFLERAEKDGLLPLSGISRVSTILCNETGSFVTYSSTSMASGTRWESGVGERSRLRPWVIPSRMGCAWRTVSGPDPAPLPSDAQPGSQRPWSAAGSRHAQGVSPRSETRECSLVPLRRQ